MSDPTFARLVVEGWRHACLSGEIGPWSPWAAEILSQQTATASDAYDEALTEVPPEVPDVTPR